MQADLCDFDPGFTAEAIIDHKGEGAEGALSRILRSGPQRHPSHDHLAVFAVDQSLQTGDEGARAEAIVYVAQLRGIVAKRGAPAADLWCVLNVQLQRDQGSDSYFLKAALPLVAQNWIEVQHQFREASRSHKRRSKRDLLLSLSAGSLPLGGDRQLHFPDLAMRPDDRIAITGPNGGGKSTLVRHLVERLNVPPERVVYMPQEIDAQQSRSILERARSLPRELLGQTMTAVSRLGSRPERLLESAEPSPGEVRKILLAMGIASAPHIVVMDEPTNHLDLPSIECLEAALDQCPCGLLLVSHDFRFLQRLARRRWQIEADEEGKERLTAGEGWG